MGLPTGAEQKVTEVTIKTEDAAAGEDDANRAAATMADTDTATAAAKADATDAAEVSEAQCPLTLSSSSLFSRSSRSCSLLSSYTEVRNTLPHWTRPLGPLTFQD